VQERDAQIVCKIDAELPTPDYGLSDIQSFAVWKNFLPCVFARSSPNREYFMYISLAHPRMWPY